MPSQKPIVSPARFAPATAIGFSDEETGLVLVSNGKPLPVQTVRQSPNALIGTLSGAATSGPFAAVPGLPIVVALGGEWQGTIRLLRSSDGGASKMPLSASGIALGYFSQPGVEQVWEETQEDITFFLQADLSAGEAIFEVSQ